jgi:hypothetical protein
VGGVDIDRDVVDRDVVRTLLLTHRKSPLRAFEGALALSGGAKNTSLTNIVYRYGWLLVNTGWIRVKRAEIRNYSLLAFSPVLHQLGYNRRQIGSRWEMAIVDIPSMPNCFDDQDIFVPVQRDDRSVVASTKLVVWIPGELFEAMGGPIFRLIEFLNQPLLRLGVESL